MLCGREVSGSSSTSRKTSVEGGRGGFYGVLVSVAYSKREQCIRVTKLRVCFFPCFGAIVTLLVAPEKVS